MNVQEREQLVRFLVQLGQAQAVQKDSEAEALIKDACERQPDAHYLLVQRAMLLDHALQEAQGRIARLQVALDQVGAGERAGLSGGGPAWGQAPVAAAAAPFPHGGWGSGWLGNIASTAAGVAAGSFLFQGLESLFGHHGSWGGSGFLPGGVSENTVINNYYDSAGAGGLDAVTSDEGAGDDGGGWV